MIWFDAWRTVLYEEDRIQATTAQQPNLVDTVVLRLLQGYHNRPFHPIPDFPPSYDTHDRALSGALQPAQYKGRMLPDDLVNGQRYYVDQCTKRRFDYAKSVNENPLVIPLDIFIPIFECNTIMYITTDAWSDLVVWFDSFRRYKLS